MSGTHPIGARFERTNKGVVYLYEKTLQGPKKIGRITPYVAPNKARGRKQYKIYDHLPQVQKLPENKIKPKNHRKPITLLERLKGTEAVYIAENERTKVSVKVNSKMTVFCYPEQVQQVKAKYGLI